MVSFTDQGNHLVPINLLRSKFSHTDDPKETHTRKELVLMIATPILSLLPSNRDLEERCLGSCYIACLVVGQERTWRRHLDHALSICVNYESLDGKKLMPSHEAI